MFGQMPATSFPVMPISPPVGNISQFKDYLESMKDAPIYKPWWDYLQQNPGQWEAVWGMYTGTVQTSTGPSPGASVSPPPTMQIELPQPKLIEISPPGKSILPYLAIGIGLILLLRRKK